MTECGLSPGLNLRKSRYLDRAAHGLRPSGATSFAVSVVKWCLEKVCLSEKTNECSKR
jgi:hypothetical protein